MRKFIKVFFVASIGVTIVAAVSVLPTPATAAPIGQDSGKCQQKAHFKDKMCACKDSACAQKLQTSAAKKGGGTAAAPKVNGADNKKQ